MTRQIKAHCFFYLFMPFNREGAKNNGGKKQAYYQPQVITGKRQGDRLLVLGGCTQRSETSGIL